MCRTHLDHERHTHSQSTVEMLRGGKVGGTVLMMVRKCSANLSNSFPSSEHIHAERIHTNTFNAIMQSHVNACLLMHMCVHVFVCVCTKTSWCSHEGRTGSTESEMNGISGRECVCVCVWSSRTTLNERRVALRSHLWHHSVSRSVCARTPIPPAFLLLGSATHATHRRVLDFPLLTSNVSVYIRFVCASHRNACVPANPEWQAVHNPSHGYRYHTPHRQRAPPRSVCATFIPGVCRVI